MNDFHRFVVEEKDALSVRVSGIEDFIHGDDFQFMPHKEQWRLGMQLAYMRSYLEILHERIEHFRIAA